VGLCRYGRIVGVDVRDVPAVLVQKIQRNIESVRFISVHAADEPALAGAAGRDGVPDCESKARISNNQSIIMRDDVNWATPPVSDVPEIELYGGVPILGFERMLCLGGKNGTETGKDEKNADYMVAW